jgi:hypothetical protein
VTESPNWPAEGQPPPLAEPPRISGGDLAYAGVKGSLGLIPVLGGPTVALFEAAVATPLENVATTGFVASPRVCRNCRSRSKTSIQSRWPTTKLSSPRPIKPHKPSYARIVKKRDAMRNAVLNSAVGTDLDEEEQQAFVGLIHTLTSHGAPCMQLAVLEVLASPSLLPVGSVVSAGVGHSRGS